MRTLLLLLVAAGCSGGAYPPSNARTESVVSVLPTECLGFLESSHWSSGSRVSAFALVKDAQNLDRPAREWRIECEPWCFDSELLSRFQASVDLEKLESGHLTIDPTRYLAVSFGDDSFRLMQVADIAPGATGTAIFADAFAPLEKSFASIIIEAHGLDGFTVP